MSFGGPPAPVEAAQGGLGKVLASHAQHSEGDSHSNGGQEQSGKPQEVILDRAPERVSKGPSVADETFRHRRDFRSLLAVRVAGAAKRMAWLLAVETITRRHRFETRQTHRCGLGRSNFARYCEASGRGLPSILHGALSFPRRAVASIPDTCPA